MKYYTSEPEAARAIQLLTKQHPANIPMLQDREVQGWELVMHGSFGQLRQGPDGQWALQLGIGRLWGGAILMQTVAVRAVLDGPREGETLAIRRLPDGRVRASLVYDGRLWWSHWSPADWAAAFSAAHEPCEICGDGWIPA